MAPGKNPYSPGAGRRPPELAGRDEILNNALIAIHQNKSGRLANSLMFVGLRGVGKTALLNHVSEMAEKEGAITDFIEVNASERLSATITETLRSVLLKLDYVKDVNEKVKRGLRVLKSFVKAARVKYNDMEFFLDIDDEPGVADSGRLSRDLRELFIAVGEAAKARGSSIIIFIDEIHNLPADEFEALILAVHRINQLGLPVMIIGAGLPLLVKLSGDVKSYSERLFEYPDVGPLDKQEARRALTAPLQDSKIKIEEDATQAVIDQAKGYPYFLQVWGYETWNAAETSPITIKDVRKAGEAAVKRLDKNFFRVRYERLSQPQQNYAHVMAKLGPGPQKTGDIAAKMGKRAQQLGSTRDKMIAKGMIYSPEYGKVAFTVPLFDEYLNRIKV